MPIWLSERLSVDLFAALVYGQSRNHHVNINSNLYTKQVNCYTTSGTPYGNGSDITSFTGVAVDGSGYIFNVSNYSQLRVTSPDGWLVYDSTGASGFQWPSDTNGNYIQYAVAGQPDTLGRISIIWPPVRGCPFGSSSTPVSVHASDGSAATYTLNCTTMPVSSIVAGTPVTQQEVFPTSLALPDGTQYSFTYDTGSSPTHLGDLLSVTLPTGGQILFTHVPGDINYPTSPFPGWVTSATFGGGTWNLSYAQSSQNLQITTTVTSPPRYDSASNSNISDKTVFVSVPYPTPPNPSALQSVQYYAGSSTLLKTINITYDGNGNYLPINIATTLNDTGQSSTVSYQYFNFMRDYPTQKQESDFTGTVRTTKITYNGFMKPTSVNIYSGTGTGSPIASTIYTYDEYSANYCKNVVPMLSAVTGATGHQDAYGTGAVGRGNVTTIQRLMSGTNYATTHMCYNTLGEVTQTVDANGNPTSFDYSENWADTACIPAGTNTHAFPTTVTDALGHQTKTSYYTCTNLRHSVQDPNDLAANRSGTVFTYDELNRPLTTAYPDTGSTAMAYPSPNLITTTRAMGSGNMQTATILDGYGRTTQTQLNSDPDCSTGDKTDTTYSALGKVQSVSNPYCTTSDSTYGITSYAYDALGRTTQVTDPDGSTVLTTYKGTATQVQDEGNGTQRATRISQTDGFGRLTSVCEVAPGPFVGPGGTSSASLIGSNGTPASCGLAIAGTGFLTSYQYDVLDNLLQVNQSGIAPRTFGYDSLSRLTSASNPESGTISYTYDANSNLATKVAPAPNQTGSATVTTTYSHDALNRLLSKTYNDGTTPSAVFTYDVHPSWNSGSRQNAVGRMTSWATVSCLVMLYDYDSMGRPVGRSELQPSNCTAWHPIANTYDLMGNMTSQQDGNFHTASYTYNTAGRLTGVTDSQSAWPTNLLYSVHYNALGQITSDSTGYGEIEAYSYDKRDRQQSSTITFNGYPVYSFSVTSFAPNGNILAANDSSNGNWTYSYDQFNRLSGANQNSGAAVYSYVYDRFGNRWQQNGPHAFTATFTGNNPSNPANNNRIDGYSYDAAGNLIADGTHTYTYDAENRLIKVDSGNTSTFVYDGEGHRFSKTNSSTINSGGDTPDPIGTTEFVYDPQGHLVHTEAPNGGTGWRGEVFAGSRHLATYAGNLVFAHADWLGTERNRDLPDSNAPQYPSNQNITSLPFGDWLDNTQGIVKDWTPLNFTGQYHDFETDLDYFGARYYSPVIGRFTSSDPQNAGASLDAPQSWNAYSYASNNPLNYIDPGGMDCIHINNDTGKFEGFESGDCDNSTEEKANSGYYVDGTVNTLFSTTGDSQGVVTGYSGTNTDSGTPTLISGSFGTPLDVPPVDALSDSATAIFAQFNRDIFGSRAFQNCMAQRTTSFNNNWFIKNFSLISAAEDPKPFVKTTAEAVAVKVGVLGLGYGGGAAIKAGGNAFIRSGAPIRGGTYVALGEGFQGAAFLGGKALTVVGTAATTGATVADMGYNLRSQYACRAY